MRTLPTALIATGVLLMLLSPMWSRIASSSMFWDEQAVEEYSESVSQLHHANTEAAINPTGTKDAEQAQEQFRQNQAKFNRARQFRERGGPMMRLVGGGVALLGVGLYFATRRTEE